MLALLIALGTAGMDVTVVTFMGVAGVDVGLAMQGVLGNIFARSLTIILSKPFRVSEYIEIAGERTGEAD